MLTETENMTIRIPVGLREKIKDAAEKEFRSMNRHIVAVLSADAGFTPSKAPSRPKPKGDEE